MNEETKQVILSIVLSLCIVSLIFFGFMYKFLGLNFLGYISTVSGALSVYYLSLKYFEKKEYNTCRVCGKPLGDKLGLCANCGKMTLREFLKLKLKEGKK